MSQSTSNRRISFRGDVMFAAVCFLFIATASVVAEEPHPVNTPDPVADRHGDTFDGVKITPTEKKFDNGLTSLFVEGFQGADGKFVRHGWTITYYESGHKRTKTLWRNGVPDGIRLSWYQHGQLWSRGRFVQGLEDGLWERWHENGQKFTERGMRRGAWHGVYIEWHPNGKKRTEVEFVNGLRQGPSYLYDEQGVLATKTDYVDGVEQP